MYRRQLTSPIRQQYADDVRVSREILVAIRTQPFKMFILVEYGGELL